MGTDFSRLSGRCARVLHGLGAARRVLLLLPVALATLATTVGAQTAPPGGFLETAVSVAVRPRVTPTLPSRGSFTFPAPYNTTGIRLTNSSDCGGADCVDYVGYSYWRNTNNHVGSNTMLIFVTLDRARGGGGPTLFSLDKTTDQVTKVGPLFDPSSALSWASAEGWYWSATQASKLYVASGAVLSRYDVNTKQMETVFDASTKYPGTAIWQTHTSNDDKVHSATLRDNSGVLGCLVYDENTRQFSQFPKTGDFDECQIDKSGQWLLIKEQVDGKNDVDNVIVNLVTGDKVVLYDQYGAPGHSDNGYGYMVGEDNWYPLPGAVRVWTFSQPFPSSEPGTPPQGLLVYRTTDWSTDAGHVSHADAQPGVVLDQQYACASNANRLSLPRTNEIVCFRLDGSLQVLVVAPVMTDLNAPGGGDDYSKLPKGNLDVTGQYFIWTSNVGGNRLDAFIVKVPSQLLVTPSGGGGGGGGSTTDTTPPSIVVSAPATGSTVLGTATVTASASDDKAVVGVQFKLDGVNLGAELTTSPYSLAWNTTTVTDGAHTITAMARDAAGNQTTSAGVSVVVLNDSGGGGGGDTTPPSVTVTVPGAGSTLSGSATLTASVSDDTGVVGVQFQLDGANLGSELKSGPYSMTWDTTSAANGTHSVTAIARDAAGNTTTSGAVAMVVSNTTSGGGGGPEDVTWTSVLNASTTGNGLKKTGGCAGCHDAGAVSQQSISANGYVEFTVTESGLVQVGLARVADSAQLDSTDYAIRVQGGVAEVREKGIYRTDTRVVAGQVLRIAILSNVVSYYKNGALFYTSGVSPTYPLRAVASLLDPGSLVTNVVMAQTLIATPSLSSAVLPGSRAALVGTPVTALATLVASGAGTATGCTIAPITDVPADFRYRTTNAGTNEVTGPANGPVDIAAGHSQTFVITFTPTAPFSMTQVQLKFACSNTSAAPVVAGLNTLLLSASASPVPDLVAMAATPNADGIVGVPGDTGTGVFSVATINLGSGGAMTVTADIGDAPLPLLLKVCQTNPTSGMCLAPPAAAVTTQVNPGETPTFGVFATGSGYVPFDPATNRINVHFKDGTDVIRGSTSVAVRTM